LKTGQLQGKELFVEPLALLKETFPFSGLREDDRKSLAKIATFTRYRRGEVIFVEGEPSYFFYTVAHGSVKVFKLTPQGREAVLEIFGSGAPLGAVAVFEGFPYPASAMALEETVCIRIKDTDLFSLLDVSPLLVRSLLSALTRRLVVLSNRLVELSEFRIEARIAQLFLRLVREIGNQSEMGIIIPMLLSRQDLASLTGTTLETSIRIMSRWGKEGPVITERRRFVVTDMAALERLSLS
jgi:CRP-like cAMP-binding protein